MKNRLSVTIITKNEEENIKRCLESVKWVDEIVVVDSGSSDKTVEICKDFGCKVIETDWKGFGKTKKFAVDSAKNDWIFSVDADEEVTYELKDRIKSILKSPKYSGYRIKRSSFYLGRNIKQCWNKDYPLRIFNRKYGNFNKKIAHESVELKGKIGTINERLLHYTYPNISSHIQKMDKYTELGAKQKSKEGKRITISGSIIRGGLKFIKMYFINRGFLDGKEGFILSLNSAFGVYLKYLKLWEIRKNERKD